MQLSIDPDWVLVAIAAVVIFGIVAAHFLHDSESIREQNEQIDHVLHENARDRSVHWDSPK